MKSPYHRMNCTKPLHEVHEFNVILYEKPKKNVFLDVEIETFLFDGRSNSAFILIGYSF